MNLMDDYLAKLPAWQVEHLTTFRQLVHKVRPDIGEDFKWNVPVFVLNGKTIFAMAAFKDHIKYNYLHGSQLTDQAHLFNNGFNSKTSRAIDLREDQMINLAALEALISDAIAAAS